MAVETNAETYTRVILEVFKLSGMLNAAGDELTEEFGLSSARWKVMGAIAKSETLLTVSEIARTMGQSRQATQRLVDVMSKDGLLTLIVNPNHKRAKFVDLTDEGQRVYALLDKKQIAWATRGAEGFTAEELKQALSTLQKMTDYFSG